MTAEIAEDFTEDPEKIPHNGPRNETYHVGAISFVIPRFSVEPELWEKRYP